MSVQLFNSRLYNKVAVVPTILISGVYHEYVLWAPMRYVMPVLLVQFGVFGGKHECSKLIHRQIRSQMVYCLVCLMVL